ncbi:TrmH family RNA methyltransferase [Mesomycoplasma molare]|uniref:RNA methyltransferase n=1 Tax=Mesomycoplasma molare TaxID=171288 RepID=A0ABY5TTL9_9BACT|nr:RNA methyltransferase [Mesomycoplasma molare]UWD33930.1 RNA methyltransferase [Mesomycoplasma molare]
MKITSVKNEHIIKLAKLKIKKYRDKFNLYIIENWKIIEEALKEKIVVEILTSNEEFFIKNIKITYVTQEIIKKLSSNKNPQDFIAICKKREEVKNITDNRIVVLDNIQDPGNLGTILRNCLSFGFFSLIIQGVDVYNEKVIRSSQGAFFHLNIVQTNNLELILKNLKDKYFFYGTILNKNSKELATITNNKEKFAIIFGNEGNGISDQIKKMIDENIYIGINFESLNVAVANGIILNKFKEIN